ncbi:MAG: LamB/YcsF family protein [Saprospiraceae bacterium]|nr:LamB/YcsF family protein [Saprospiraceae bacterium]
MKSLHINCDMGESFGNYNIGNDEVIMPYVDACNIACGFHAGDPVVIEKTIKLALKYDKEIGAHPSYPDLHGFGRRKMKIPKDELKSIIKYQICAIKAITESMGGILSHVKAHGALYNCASVNENEASAIVETVLEIDTGLILYAPYRSAMEKVALNKGLKTKRESFADRTYTPDGKLTARSENNSIINDPYIAWQQVQMLLNGRVKCIGNATIPMHTDTICFHSDHPETIEILEFVRSTYLHMSGK